MKNAKKTPDMIPEVSELKDSLDALKELQTLLKEFPTLLEAASQCRSAKSRQEKYEAKPNGHHPHQAEETPTMDGSADYYIQVDIIFQVRPIGDIPSRLEDKCPLRPSAPSKLPSLCVC
ncbi:hypothetical protein AVEN_193527-1 [Araneus ventricosus]|uniref:Uncharacterized protein n=1 Tax=Araneus ventricosus TaxID=182803 RepID=A0A4Y2PGS2_ARAVE|nr:hypothetical protein AVEN_193527-1 [Araneus ventricosus]